MVDMANGADIDMGFLPLKLATSSSDCEGAVASSGGGGRKVEDCGGINEGRGEMGCGGCEFVGV